MNAIRRSSIIIGILFILAEVFSILGHVLYGPILNNPDYMIYGPTSENQIVLGAIFEMLAAISVAGTAIAFFPILRERNERKALGYIGGSLLEAFLIIIGLVSILTLLTLRREFALEGVLDSSFIAYRRPTVTFNACLGLHPWVEFHFRYQYTTVQFDTL